MKIDLTTLSAKEKKSIQKLMRKAARDDTTFDYVISSPFLRKLVADIDEYIIDNPAD